jgi:hypothetical protein
MQLPERVDAIAKRLEVSESRTGVCISVHASRGLALRAHGTGLAAAMGERA